MTNRQGSSANNAARRKLHTVTPREMAGRDAIARYEAQFRGAALACLRILEGTVIDRVYCDYHDDFVERETTTEGPVYHFVQVKTKKIKKHQWSRLELFGIPTKLPSHDKKALAPGGSPTKLATPEQLAKIRQSFIGKLLEHTVDFGDACATIKFLTNVYLHDDVETVIAAIKHGNVAERTVRYLADNYAAIFEVAPPPTMRRVHTNIRKLSMSQGHDYLDPNHTDFDTKAVKALYQYSEIDLSHTEGIELVKKLLALVQKRSGTKAMSELTEKDLDDTAGVGIDDLLDLLPISRGAYRNFLTNGDASALKNATVLQRKLSQAGATAEIIETASRWKVAWDNWFRTYRHMYERDITFLQQDLNVIYGRWQRSEVSFSNLQNEVDTLKKKLTGGPLESLLTEEMLTGGILAELVRSESR